MAKKTTKKPSKKTTGNTKAATGLTASSPMKSAVPKRAKDVLARKNSDGSFALMRLDNDEFFFTIDGIAAQIWSMFDGKTSVESIELELRKKHKNLPPRFGKDVTSLIKQLSKEKLINL